MNSNGRIVLAIILNFMICLFELVGGILAGSLALLADALHNFSDGMAIVVSFFARKIGQRSPNQRMTFGYKRAEILAALINSSVIVIIAFFLIREAYFRFINPQEITTLWMIGVGIFGLIADLASVILLYPETHHSLNMRSAYLHLLSDTLSSVAVITAGMMIYFYNFYLLDPILTVLIAMVIFFQGYQILKQSTMILMERVPASIRIKDIRDRIELLPQVDNLHHIHVWQIDENKILFEGHITLKEDMKISQSEIIRQKIEKILEEDFNILHPTVQIEFSYCSNGCDHLKK
ncbi:MAG: cation transporter [Candidatus Atribacteria bacterium]|nr:cation transporter [Candidatus Atribacteria bacterium]